MNKFNTPSLLGLEKQKVTDLQSEVEALKECISNYEDAIRQAQSETKRISVIARGNEKKLKKLIKLVQHNTKNADTILYQLGN